MTKIKSLLLVAVLGCIAISTPLRAQSVTNTTPPDVPTGPLDVIHNIGSYFTDVDTSKTWTNTPTDIWTGANYQNNINTSAELGASYDIWYISPSAAFAPEAVVRNAGVAGTIVSAAPGVGFSLFHYDLKITGYVDAGENFALDSAYVEFGGRLKKKFTTSTYGGIGLGFEHLFKSKNSNTPTVTAYVGWTF